MTNDKAQMSNQAQNPNDKKEYDLEERTARFGEQLLNLLRDFPETLLTIHLLVR